MIWTVFLSDTASKPEEMAEEQSLRLTPGVSYLFPTVGQKLIRWVWRGPNANVYHVTHLKVPDKNVLGFSTKSYDSIALYSLKLCTQSMARLCTTVNSWDINIPTVRANGTRKRKVEGQTEKLRGETLAHGPQTRQLSPSLYNVVYKHVVNTKPHTRLLR